MKEKSKSEVSIIGGADGPTSIFIAGRTRKKPLKVRIRNIIYRYRRKIVEKKVVADSHTLDELVQYAMNTYNLIETNSTERKYIEQQKNLKESLILQHKPEVLGEMVPLLVIKKDNKRELYDRNKIQEGIIRSCHKRPVSINTISEIVDEIETKIFNLDEKEIPTSVIGEMVMDKLKDIDAVAYVRFASVYREFKDINTFMVELKKFLQ